MISASNIDKAFDNIAIKKIKRKIKEFQKNSNSYEESELYEKIKKVLFFDINGIGFSLLTAGVRKYQVSTQVFRVRKFEKNTISEEDLWEPPENVVDYGRFNKPKESYLYTTVGDFDTPKKEVGVSAGDRYIVIYYNVTATLSLFELGFNTTNISGVKDATKKKVRLLNKFIKKNILSKKNGAYRISSILSNDIANSKSLDGWCYPSIHNNKAINACIKKSSKSKLEIKSIFLCEDSNDKDRYLYSMVIDDDSNMHIYSDWNDEDSKAYKILNQMYDDNKQVQTIKVPDVNETLFILNVVSK